MKSSKPIGKNFLEDFISDSTQNALNQKEDKANKQNSMILDGNGIKFPTVDAVNLQANNLLKVASGTGFIDYSDTFNMVLTNPTTITITGSNPGTFVKSRLFQAPFVPEDAIKNITSRTLLASSISLPSDGRHFRFLGYDYTTDSIVSSITGFFLVNNIVAIGVVELLRSGGVNTFTSFQMQLDVSTVSLFDLTMSPNQNTSKIFPNTDLTTSLNAGVVKSCGISWGQSNPHIKLIPSSSAVSFIRIDPGYLTTTTGYTNTTNLDTTTYWNGTSLVSTGNNNSASVQRVLLHIDGRIFIQAGEQNFSKIADAQTAAQNVTFTDIIPAELVIEIARIAAVKTTSNLSNTTQAQFYYTTVGGSVAGGSTSFATIGGSPYDNTLLGAELNARPTGSGTINYIPKWNSTSGLGNSNISDNGTLVNSSTDMNVNGIFIGRGANNLNTNVIVGSVGIGGNGGLGRSTAVGQGASASISAATDQTAVGYNAIGFNQNGGANVGLGSFAGYYTNNKSTALTTIVGSTFIGYRASALNDSDINETVIGYDANGIGSNSVVLGNDSVTKTALKGNVLIGQTGTITDNGTDKLQVNGSGLFTGKISSNNAIQSSGALAVSTPSSIVIDQVSVNQSRIMSFGNDSVTKGIISFFQFNNNASVGSETVRLSAATNVLIGTTTDNGTDKLQVNGSIKIIGKVNIDAINIANGFSELLRIGENGSLSSNYGLILKGNSGTGLFSFHSLTGGVENSTPSLGINRVTSNVLIGTTSDNGVDKLQVNGSALVNGLKHGNSIGISNTDLDNLIVAGFYSGGSLTNAPVGVNLASVLVEQYVSGTSIRHQLLTVLDNAILVRGKIFSRVRDSSGWSAWSEILTSASGIISKVISTTTYTLINSDNNTQLIFTNSSPITLTIPAGLTSALSCEVLQQGTGQITFTASGTTLQYSSFEYPTTYAQNSLVAIDNVPNLTETYHLFGQLTSI